MLIRKKILGTESDLKRAEALFDAGEFDAARQLLAPLIEKNNGAAIRLDCSYSDWKMSEQESELRYVNGIVRAAECGDLESLYIVGFFYDMGDYDAIPMDKEKASHIFKEAADKGHAHSMWIHATELLWGKGSYPQSMEEGRKYLDMAIEAESGEACITKARLLFNGELGLAKDPARAEELRILAKKFDDTVYDPFD